MQTSGVQNKLTVSIRLLRCSLLLSRWCLDILCHSSSHGRRGNLLHPWCHRSLWSLSLPLIVLWVWRLLMCSLPPPPIPPPEDQCSVWRKERRKDRHCRSGKDDNDMKERYRKEDMQARTSQERVKRKKCPNLNLDASAEMYSISGIDVRFHLGVLGRGSLLLLWVPIYYSNNCSE